jgi:hypothetical protein
MILVVALIFAVVCALIAHYKGRNPIGWFFIGFFFGVFGLIVILVVSNLKELKDREVHSEMERRRLREQLRQEQLKNEQFRKYTQVRLDAHDNRLQMDTRHIGPLLEQSGIRPLLGNAQDPANETVIVESNDKNQRWYFQKGKSAEGPYPLEHIRQLIRQGRIDSFTRLWHETLVSWTPAGQVDTLRTEFNNG